MFYTIQILVTLTTTDLAISHAQRCRESADPVKYLLDICYVSLSLLYCDLARDGEIAPLRELPDEKKKAYWKQTEGSVVRRIWSCQALFMFDLLNGGQDATTATGNAIESPGIVGEG